MSKLNLRKVIVSKYGHDPIPGDPNCTRWVFRPRGEALFHQFGVGHEVYEGGVGNFTTAVVEWPDGLVENVPVEHVRFVAVSTRRSADDDDDDVESESESESDVARR